VNWWQETSCGLKSFWYLLPNSNFTGEFEQASSSSKTFFLVSNVRRFVEISQKEGLQRYGIKGLASLHFTITSLVLTLSVQSFAARVGWLFFWIVFCTIKTINNFFFIVCKSCCIIFFLLKFLINVEGLDKKINYV
jgi:hypothetical protein